MASSALDALEAKLDELEAAVAKAAAEHEPKLKELESKPTEQGWQAYRDSLSALEKMVTTGRGYATEARTAVGLEQAALASVIPRSAVDWFNFLVERIGKLLTSLLEFFAEWWADESTVTKLLKDRETWIRIATHAQAMPKAVSGDDSFKYLKGSAGELVPLDWEGHVANIYYATVRQQAVAVGHLAGLADMMPTAILAATNGALSIMASLGALVWRLVTPLLRLIGKAVKVLRSLFVGIRRLLAKPREVGKDIGDIWQTLDGKALWKSVRGGASAINGVLKDIVMAFGNLILAIYAYLYGETILKQQTEVLKSKVALPVWEHSHDWPKPRDLAGRLWPSFKSVNGRPVLDIGGRSFDLPATP